MKMKYSWTGFLLASATLLFFSCESPVLPSGEEEFTFSELRAPKDNNGKGKGKNKDDNDGDNGEVDPFVETYILTQAEDPDPLYKFSISQSGNLILLQSDPNVAGWGEDYYGYWSDPFPYGDNHVTYTIGLTTTTYEFEDIGANRKRVKKTLMVAPYLGGETTTTVTYPGIFSVL